MHKLIELTVGILAVVVLGAFGLTGWLLKKVAPTPEETPTGIDKELWKNLLADRLEVCGKGRWVGLLEIFLSLAAFWPQPHGFEILVAWLAFKVASKWAAWQHIVQVPSKLDGIGEKEWYVARSHLASWLLTRFQFGTLINVLLGLLAAWVGSHASKFLVWLCYMCQTSRFQDFVI